MSRRNGGYPVERARHAPSGRRGVGLCGAGTRGHLGVYIGDPTVPSYKPSGVTCERCKAKLAKIGKPVPSSKSQLRRCVCGHTWLQHGIQSKGSCIVDCPCRGFTARANQKTITFSDLKRLQMVSETSGHYQLGRVRCTDVGIGMHQHGPADGSETLVTEEDGSVPADPRS